MTVKGEHKQTEVGLIPEDWDVRTMDSLVRLMTNGFVGTATSAYVDSEDGVLYVQGYNVLEGGFNFNGVKRVSREFHARNQKSCLMSGDLLTIQTGDIGVTAVVPPELSGANCHALVISRLDRKVADPRFYCQYFNSNRGRTAFKEIETGSTMKHLNVGDMKLLRLPCPPTVEQHAIASALCDVDELLVGLERLIAKKRDIKQAAMQQLLTGETRLPDFRESWEVKELCELGSVSGSGVDKKIRSGELPVRLVNYMDVYRHSFIGSAQLHHTVSAPSDQVDRCAVRKGDVFFTPSSEMPFDVAASAVAVEDVPDACYSYHVVRLRLKVDWDLRFRAYAFKSPGFLQRAAQACEGSGVRYVITQGKFRKLTIRYPSDKVEQAAIADVLFEMDSEITVLESRLNKTRALKQAMMQELLTGRTRLV
jgi:type I restriction enzyme S subunit